MSDYKTPLLMVLAPCAVSLALLAGTHDESALRTGHDLTLGDVRRSADTLPVPRDAAAQAQHIGVLAPFAYQTLMARYVAADLLHACQLQADAAVQGVLADSRGLLRVADDQSSHLGSAG